MSSGEPLSYPRHMHMRHWTLGVVRHGMVELEIPNGTRQIGTGDFFLVRPRSPHALRIAEHSELVILCLDEENFLQRERIPHSAISHFLSPQEESLLERVVDHLVLAPCSLKKQENGGETRKLAQRLAAQPDEALSVVEMARIAHASPWHFLRRFQSEIGMTPHAFLLNCKICRLRSLLRDRTSAAEAAALAGFADQSHMHKVFKRHHSLTPRQFIQASSRLDSAII